MPEVVLTNGHTVASSGQQDPGIVTCTEGETQALVAAGYGTRVAEANAKVLATP
jgi:hypothetical protein